MDVGYLFLLASMFSLIVSIILDFEFIRGKKCWKEIKYANLSFLVFTALSFFTLLYYFLIRDFNVKYVFLYSDTHLPLVYTISAVWAGREGSLLLWLLYLGIFILISTRKRDRISAFANAIMCVVAVFFNFLLLTSSNPFVRLNFNPPEGWGLNPLLRTPEMALHPPAIFLGYAGMTVPFAYAVAATYYREEWIERARNYLLVAWAFLGVGILLGAWWAYKTLGWGGYWGWDPVENSSLLPWLTASALLHGVLVEERRGGLKLINYILAVVTFDLVILATFITRSGIINSVHAFARNQEAYAYLLLIGLASFVAFVVAVKRKDVFRGEAHGIRNRLIQATILIFSLATVTVLIGTLTPLLMRASVTKEFYRHIEIPLGTALVVLLGICVVAIKRDFSQRVLRSLALGAGAGIVCFGLTRLALASLGVGIFVFSLSGIIQGYSGRKIDLRKAGAIAAHLGLILLFIGVMGSWMYESSYTHINLGVGQSVKVGDYTLKLNGFNEVNGNGKFYVIAYVSVYRDGKLIGVMHPKLVIYNLMRSDRIVASVDIISMPFQDIYIAMGSVTESGIASFEFYIVPLVSFVWIGSLLIVAGGILAALPEKRERAGKSIKAAKAGATGVEYAEGETGTV